MRIKIRKVVTPVQQNEHGDHWKIVQGADIIHDLGLIIERSAKVRITPMATNNNVSASLDMVICDGSKWDTFVDFLRLTVIQTPVTRADLEAFIHSIESKMETAEAKA